MLSGAGCTHIILLIIITITAGSAALTGGVDGRVPVRPLEGVVRPLSASLPGFSMPLDNNPGLRTADVRHRNDLPAAHRNRPGSILTAPNIHTMVVPQHESNRPGRSPPQAAEGARPAHPRLLRKGGAERTCAAEGHTEGDERQAFCHSDFAVNGIIHDVDAVGGGATILTVLVTTAGLYKGKRLHLTPDTGAFSRVTVLALHRPPCPHLRLGGRYIIMGQIYHRRAQLPPPVQRSVSGRLQAGDGLVTSGRSFIRRFTRKKDSRVLGAALSKCT
ncbi:UPF0450 protein C17orf58 homolog isoform 3-T3 [Anomaloglossus baeobatrachus]|uniref:UPF0450 protein C17orf58 homolog isoform X2 n=1 Tax=Anomaloglossus baeobatrachus TaxID=238106 RepID=UPI003F4FA9AA